MKEQWKDIPNTGGYYQISNHGRIRSWKNGRWGKSKNPKIMNLGYCRRGYKRQSITYNGKRFNVSVHREVAKAFIPNPKGKEQVNHIDCNKSNNHVSNLEWVSNQENMDHAHKNNAFNYRSGEQCHSSKFSNEQVRNIRLMYSTTDITQRELADKYNCGQTTITDIVNNRSYSFI